MCIALKKFLIEITRFWRRIKFLLFVNNEMEGNSLAKITLDNVSNPENVSTINDNFDRIESALNTQVLYRNVGRNEPNMMETNLDMNGNRIYNLPKPVSLSEPARLQDVFDINAGEVPVITPIASEVPFSPTSPMTSTNVQDAIDEVFEAVQNIDTGGGGGGDVTYGGTTFPDFNMTTSTPNSRVEFANTLPAGWNTDAGRCVVSFEWIGNNFFTLNPTAHVAVVTRCDVSLLATAVRGTGIAYGALPGHAPPLYGLAPVMLNESWVNGIGPGGRDNWLLPRSESPANLQLVDGVSYRTVVESTKDHSGFRYLRHRIYRRDTVNSQWVLLNDTGDMMDPNVQADLTNHGLAFGTVITGGGAWSLNFSNVKVVWGPPGTVASDVSDKLSKRGAYLEGSLITVGTNGAGELKADGNDISFNMYGWGATPTVPKMYFKVGGTNVASVQTGAFYVHGNLDVSQTSSRIKVINTGASSQWTSFQNASASAGTNVLAIPSGSSTQSAFTAMNNTNASVAKGVSAGIAGTTAYVNAFDEAGGTAPELHLAVSNVPKIRITSSGAYVHGQSVPLGTNTGIMQAMIGLGGTNAVNFTNSSALDVEGLCTLGEITSYLSTGGVFSGAQADRLEGLLRPISSILSVIAKSARDKGCA